MKLQSITVVPGDEEVTEIPQGFEICRATFDRGIWFILLAKKGTPAKGVATLPEEGELEA